MATLHSQHAYAKLTRTLHIVGRRADGYHLLRSEMVALDLCDDLLIDEGGEGLSIQDEIQWSAAPAQRVALDVPSDGSNLVMRALSLVGRTASIQLTKRIPPGAGLGGGSSDAAAVLRAFGAFDVTMAASLGADVPFCLFGGRAQVSGVGEDIAPLVDEPMGFVVLTPSFGVSTRAVYDAYDALGTASGEGENHLEPAALIVEPRLLRIRDVMEEACGRRPILAGSGSSYFVECAVDKAAQLATELERAFEGAGTPVLISPCSSQARQAG